MLDVRGVCQGTLQVFLVIRLSIASTPSLRLDRCHELYGRAVYGSSEAPSKQIIQFDCLDLAINQRSRGSIFIRRKSSRSELTTRTRRGVHAHCHAPGTPPGSWAAWAQPQQEEVQAPEADRLEVRVRVVPRRCRANGCVQRQGHIGKQQVIVVIAAARQQLQPQPGQFLTLAPKRMT